MKRTIQAVLISVSLGLLASPGLQAEALKISAPAPDFQLRDTMGLDHKLSQYKGKLVVLEWINHGCPFVKKHYESGNMQALQKDVTKKGVVWLSISSSAKGKEGNLTANQWATITKEKGALPTAVLLDSDGTVGRLYGAKTTPHMFLINGEGKLIYQGAIDDVPTYDKADIVKAKNYVKMAIDETLAGGTVSVPETKSYGCSVKY